MNEDVSKPKRFDLTLKRHHVRYIYSLLLQLLIDHHSIKKTEDCSIQNEEKRVKLTDTYSKTRKYFKSF
jgi:hypothetical protein